MTFNMNTGQNCNSFSISPQSIDIQAPGGTGTIAVTGNPAGCLGNWTALSDASWITITGGGTGSGNGTVSYIVAANNATTSRSGRLTIAGKTVTVNQAGNSVCSYSLTSSGQLFDSSGGAGSVAVTAQTGCAWTASSNADWIIITAGASGSGNGTVNYSVAAHSGSASRSGTLQIADQTYTVSQTGGQGITPGSSVYINVSQSQPVLVETVIPEGASNFFVLLQKDSSWWGTLEVLRDGKTLKSGIGSQDFALQMQSPAPGPCTIRVTGSGSGKLSILTSLPELKLGEWTIGSILRCYGSAWYEIHVPAGQQMLSVAAETLGLWSRLEVSYGLLGASPLWTASGDTTALQIQSPAAGTYYVSLTDSAWFPDHDIPRDHQIKADMNPIEPPSTSGPVITDISPARGGTSAPITITIKGVRLDPRAKVWLARPGENDVIAQTTGGSDKCLQSTFDLAEAKPGSWFLMLQNQDGRTATAGDQFILENGGSPAPWVEILGRSTIRAGREANYTIRYGNSGNVNARFAEVVVWLPMSIRATLSATQDGKTVMLESESISGSPPEEVHGFVAIIEHLAPDYIGILQLQVESVASSLEKFEISARIVPSGDIASDIVSASVNRAGFSLQEPFSSRFNIMQRVAASDQVVIESVMYVDNPTGWGTTDHPVITLPILDYNDNHTGRFESYSEEKLTAIQGLNDDRLISGSPETIKQALMKTGLVQLGVGTKSIDIDQLKRLAIVP